MSPITPTVAGRTPVADEVSVDTSHDQPNNLPNRSDAANGRIHDDRGAGHARPAGAWPARRDGTAGARAASRARVIPARAGARVATGYGRSHQRESRRCA